MNPKNQSIQRLFLNCKLIKFNSKEYRIVLEIIVSKGEFVITPDGYQFLLHNYHNQSYLLLLSVLRTKGKQYKVPFFSFLFLVRQMAPLMPYSTSVLSKEHQDLLEDFCNIGLLFHFSYKLSFVVTKKK